LTEEPAPSGPRLVTGLKLVVGAKSERKRSSKVNCIYCIGPAIRIWQSEMGLSVSKYESGGLGKEPPTIGG